MGNRARKFISIHIPKTGGTVFNRQILQPTFNVATDYLDGDPYFGRERHYRNPKRYDVLHGHFRTRKYRHCGLPMIVWLRDPVARVVSHYEYARKNRNWICAGSAVENTLIEFAQKISNTMTFYVDGMQLCDFLFVGILELFEESMVRLGKVIDLDVRPFIQKAFTNEVQKTYRRQRNVVLEDEVRQIVAVNEKDYSIYQEALELYG